MKSSSSWRIYSCTLKVSVVYLELNMIHIFNTVGNVKRHKRENEILALKQLSADITSLSRNSVTHKLHINRKITIT